MAGKALGFFLRLPALVLCDFPLGPGLIDRYMDGWKDKWMDGWMDGWMVGWVGGWTPDQWISRCSGR